MNDFWSQFTDTLADILVNTLILGCAAFGAVGILYLVLSKMGVLS